MGVPVDEKKSRAPYARRMMSFCVPHFLLAFRASRALIADISRWHCDAKGSTRAKKEKRFSTRLRGAHTRATGMQFAIA